MLDASAPLNVWVFSRDLRRARKFYTEVLGLPLWREEPGVALHFGAGGSLLSVFPASDGTLPPHGISVLFAVPRGIDAACEELAERGVTFEEPLADRPFGRSAMFRDPDGYALWICHPSATETQFLRWRLTDRSKSRRLALNRRQTPRGHPRRPRSSRRRHPEE